MFVVLLQPLLSSQTLRRRRHATTMSSASDRDSTDEECEFQLHVDPCTKDEAWFLFQGSVPGFSVCGSAQDGGDLGDTEMEG